MSFTSFSFLLGILGCIVAELCEVGRDDVGMKPLLKRLVIEASSVEPDGQQSKWKLIWNCPIPHKVRIFAWKLASNALATMVNKKRRKLEVLDTCPVCGREPEDSMHVMYRCTNAFLLWEEMKKVWQLPKEQVLSHVGTDWLLRVLEQCSQIQRMMLLLLLWRVWYVRNEIVHDKPAPSMESSKRFLCSYMDLLLLIRQHTTPDFAKR